LPRTRTFIETSGAMVDKVITVIAIANYYVAVHARPEAEAA
jgi:hypothetical protein